MNKRELIVTISDKADISIAAAERALNAVISTVSAELAKGGEVALVGFGTFHVKERSARMGRNPRTGEPMKIEAAKVASFRVGKALKDAAAG